MQHCVLVVDGDPRSLRLLEVGLAQAGYRVLAAPGAAEATQLLDAEVPDLVIADARGADGGGFALQQTAAARPAWKRVPFLFLLHEDDAAGRMRAAQLGAGEFLIKPVYLKEALSRVALLLEKQAQRGERARFSGALSGTALLDLIQSMELSRRSGVAYVSAAGGQRGRLFFSRGQLVDAVFGAAFGADLGAERGAPDEPGAELPSLSGDDAFFRMLTCEGGEYRVEPIEVAREPRMSLSSSELIMEATRRLTHWQRATAALPPLGSVLIAAPAGALRPETLPPDVRDVLRVFDGRRTISEALAVLEHEDAGGRDPVQRLAVIAKLYAARLLTAVGRPVSGEPRKAAPTPVGLPRLTPASLSSPSLSSLSSGGDSSDAALRRVPLNLPAAVLPLPQRPSAAAPADADATPLPFPIAPRPTPPPMPAVSAVSRPTPPPMPALASVSRLTPPPMPAVSVFSRPTPPPMPGVSGVLRPTPPPMPAVALQAPAPGEGSQEAPALITQLAQRLAATRAPTPFPHLAPIPGSHEDRAERTAVEPQGGAVAVAAAVAVSEPVPVSDSQLIVLHSRPQLSGDGGTGVPAIRPEPAVAIIEHAPAPTMPTGPAGSLPPSRLPSRPPSTPPISIPHPAAVGSANLAPLGPAELLRSEPAAAGGRSWSLRLLAAAGLLGLGAGLYLLIHAPAGRSRPPEVAQPAPPPAAILPAVPIIPPAPPQAAAPAPSAPAETPPAAPAPKPPEEPAAPAASAPSAATSPSAPVPAGGTSAATAASSDARHPEPAGRIAPSTEARLALLLDKGRSLQRRGLTRQAEHVARTAQRLQPTSAAPVALLAQLALDQGDGPKAARLARHAQRLDARNADAVLVLGTVEQALGHHARARALLKRYLELAPDGERAPDVRAVLRLPR